MEQFVNLLVAVVQDIHASGLLIDLFGREIPILIHELEYYEKIARQNIEANGEILDRDFVSFCIVTETESGSFDLVIPFELIDMKEEIDFD